ncbi:rifin PIR protein,putative [Plasmodium sp. DRC-Itaito]|nr:rifin PIR protein,putative [Plasmodium sp. DRC-Itaito]
MKLHYFKILLFFFLLNILVTLYQVHNNNNEPHSTSHHKQTNRSLCECDIQSSIYDKDEDIKSVRESFDRQTTQRFQEFKERMKDKRQKRKEERDKNIQKIIEEDKKEKSLADKIEKGCLRCGCALGGGVLPVWGLVSGLWYAGWTNYAATTLVEIAKDAGIKAGVEVGLLKVKEIVTNSLVGQYGAKIPTIEVADLMAVGKFNDEVTLFGIFECINSNMKGQLYNTYQQFFTTVNTMVGKTFSGFNKDYYQQASQVVTAFHNAKEGILAEGASKTSSLTTGITASVIAIIVIVLIMVIIYLVLRYRRKKKMEKKAQYTKLLKE